MRHRRYPVKKNTKIKASDPMTKGKGPGKVDLRRKNRPPTLDEIDEQMIPRRLKDLEQAKQALKDGIDIKRKRNKRNKNKFLELTSRMGFHQRPWEDQEQLTKRIMRTKNKALDDEMMKVKAGKAGRDAKELDEEFRQLDETAKRKKLAKIALREKKLKLKEKEEKFKQSKVRKMANLDSEEDSEDAEDEEEVDSEAESINQVDEKGSDKNKKKENFKIEDNDKQEIGKKRRRLNKRERKQLKRRIQREDEEKDLLLNAREIIPFGETADAPPKFESFRKTMDPLYAQAGSKDLLLKKLMGNSVEKKGIEMELDEHSFGKKTKQKVDDQERLKVIQAYRDLKKQRTTGF
ncbi:unnamed protein product [Bursaphelenchus xylophilus]|nr:unnamed protein product [Bursaphelenchus xylophilus]CAG9116041.1 unnamed protein product [Bursaphelenchus xylophilus]